MILPDFTPNNVEFQLVASAAWSDFYKMREFLLNQLIISESRFHSTCKESFLLSFNLCRFWLIELEEDIKKVKFKPESRDEVIATSMNRLGVAFDDMSEKMQTETEYFEQGYTEVFLKIFADYKKYLLSTIRRLLKGGIEDKFHEVTKFMAQLMSHFLHILYELDYLYFSRNKTDKDNFYPFIGLDFVDVNLYRERKVSLIGQRMAYYKEHGLIDTTAYWAIKSYCSKTFLDDNYETFQIFEKLLSDIESQGIRIACIM